VRALISVYDKSGLDTFATGLHDLGCELVASGGTASYLEERSLPVTRVESLTGFAEMLGHRVVTLHPAVHGGILARRDVDADLADLEQHGIEPFDLVVVNLYPFTDVVSRPDTAESEAIEMIDIGGPALLRAAAKNFAWVAPVCRPERYPAVLAELHSGALSTETRRQLAAETFAETAAYDAAITAWFAGGDDLPDALVPAFAKERDLAYGENPHQRGAYYLEAGATRHLLSHVEQLNGRGLSYNNLNDLAAARRLADEFSAPACVIVKHANPCGAAVAESIREAYEAALAADPISAFGGVIVLNRPVPPELGARLAGHFVEVLFAPGYEDEALAALRTKESMRILAANEPPSESASEPARQLDYRRVLGGLLAQDADTDVDRREDMRVVCGEPGEPAWEALLFAWRVCRHVTSNAIVIAGGLQTIGIGAGQMSRVDAVRIAIEKAREHGHDLAGATLASDAFFPFPDGPQLALEAGVSAFIQPGGSKRDAEVIEAVEAAGAAMVFTGKRHFRH
jgi:phosphoribosylaminoimidazolecarboxamide formyltransferase/IMP cyclohydrolase